jgi:DHA2 family multidrug resistance protein-like MFS transporter
MLPVLLVSVDNTVLSFALPAISAALNPSGTGLLWIVDIYPLVLAGLLVAMGSFADRVGRRRLLLIGSAGFATASALAAYSPDAGLLIAARAMLGFFGAMLMPSTLSLLRNIFPDRAQRRLAIAVWASGFASGAALGPIVGGLLLEHFWWGSVFLMAVPVLVLLLVLAPIFVPESRDPSPAPVDLVSIGLSLLAMTPVVLGIKSAAKDGVTLAALTWLALGAVAGTVFVHRQLRSTDPMLDMRLFTRGAFSGAVAVNLFSVFSIVGFLFFVSQHLQLVLGLAPMNAGLVRRVHPSRVVAGGMALAGAGYSMVALLADHISALELMFAFVVLAIGIGGAETISNDLIIATVPPSKAGAASAISETAYEVGAVLGTAVLGSILTASYRAHVQLPGRLDQGQANAAAETLGGATAVADDLPAGQAGALLESARHAFDSGVVVTSSIGVVVMVAATTLALLTLRSASADS